MMMAAGVIVMAQIRRKRMPQTVQAVARWVAAHPARVIAALVVAVLGLGTVVGGSLLAGGESFRIERSPAADAVALEGTDAAGSAPTDGPTPAPAASDTSAAATEEPATLVVDVGGAVANPGVVELEGGARVADAIAAAGGLTADADADALNQAATVSDGEKVYVPREGEAAPFSADATSSGGAAGTAAGGGLVNINTATVEELDALPGVGPATAQAIIDERAANGAFTSPEDIMRVSGIGEKKYENLADLICV